MTTEKPNDTYLKKKTSFLKKINFLFLFIVIIPTLISIIYYTFIASDIFISQSSFIIRAPERAETASTLGSFLQATGFASDRRDSYTIQNFITSRDALKQIDNDFDIRKLYSNSDIDLINRFPGIQWWKISFEDLYLYYKKFIASVQIDAGTSISTLTVRAFSAEDAIGINKKLLTMSESLVNKLNNRAMSDMILYAETEVTVAEQKAKYAAIELSTFQDKKNIINPEQQSTIQLQHVAKLQDELISTQGLLKQLQIFTAENPQIPALKQRERYLKQEIAKETNKVAGGNASLANTVVVYQRLMLDREFAYKRLASALASLESIKNEAQRQQLYLERIAQPSKPDQAMEPRRLQGIVAIFIVSLLVYGISTLLYSGIREHQS